MMTTHFFQFTRYHTVATSSPASVVAWTSAFIGGEPGTRHLSGGCEVGIEFVLNVHPDTIDE
jgi:hypothetical protein